jgi:TBC1 domain family member 14
MRSPVRSASGRKRSSSLLGDTRAAVDRVSEWFESAVREVFQNSSKGVDEEAERKREAVWRSDYLDDWEAFLKRARSQEEWRKGVPLPLRAHAWRLAVPVGEQDISRAQFIELAALAARLRRQTSMVPDATEFQSTSRLIEVDLPRTFGHTNTFKPGQPLYADLRTILEVFSVHDPVLGYVQGMSYHAAVLLFYLDPYESFRIFSSLMRHTLFRSLFLMESTQVGVHESECVCE